MNNFSVKSLFSAPVMYNERVLPKEFGEQAITLLTMLDFYANKKYAMFPDDQIKNGLTFEMRCKLREKWYADETFIDSFKEEYGEALKPVHLLLDMWKRPLSGKFLVMKYFPEYALFQSLDETNAFFAVRGLNDDFENVIPKKPPFLVQTTLLPFYDTIIWDGIVFLSDMEIEKSVANEIIDMAKKVRKHDVVIKSLIKMVPNEAAAESADASADNTEKTENNETDGHHGSSCC